MRFAPFFWATGLNKTEYECNPVAGLNHLHSRDAPLIHKNFKTNNVLVDENFIAKVADAGLARLLRGSDDAGPSHGFRSNVYQDPE